MLAVLVSCGPDVNHDLPDSQFYLIKKDGQEIVDVTFSDRQVSGELKVHAYLGGFNGATGSVTLVEDEDVLLDYNEKNGTSYMFLPEEAYQMSDDVIRVTPDSRAVSFTCMIDCNYLRGLDDLDEYLLPLSILSDDLPVNQEKKSICYRFSVKNMTLLMNNPGVEEVRMSSDGDKTKTVNVSVVTDGENLTVDYDYKFHCLDASAQGESAEIIGNLLGYGRLAPADSYTIVSENVVKEGTKEAVSELRFDVEKLPVGVSYIAVALDDDDLAASSILSKAKVYRIFRDAAYLPRTEWTVPYCNAIAKGSEANFGTHLLLDDDLATIWESPYKESRNGYDKYFDKWPGCVWTHIANNYARLPMFCILDMAQTKTISGVKISRRTMSHENAKKTKTGEIWVSNDTAGDDALPEVRTNVKGDIKTTEAESQAWNSKTFTKICDFDFSAVNNNQDQDMVIYFEARQARYVKIYLTEDVEAVPNPVLSLSEINVLGK